MPGLSFSRPPPPRAQQPPPPEAPVKTKSVSSINASGDFVEVNCYTQCVEAEEFCQNNACIQA
eukprot:1138951-Pelagomonas_calceolata.AAC.2